MGATPPPPRPARLESPIVVHSPIAPTDRLADEAAALVPEVERAVLKEKKPADRVLGTILRTRAGLGVADRRFINQAVLALFRWRGWIDRLEIESVEGRLLLSTLLDSTDGVPPVCKVWARRAGWDSSRLFALGDAPTWHGRVEGLRQILGERPVAGDPWLVFPTWLREHLPPPPGGESAKTFHLEFLRSLQQRPPLWVRAAGDDPAKIWKDLTGLGLKPWLHRRLATAAKLETDVEVAHLPVFKRGLLEIQDLAAQVVGLVCDPDPGERWWDACAGLGGKAIHLSALMKGRGVVVASDIHEPKLRELTRRARRTPFRNVTTRPWDGKRLVGKGGSYQGVLVDPPSSAIGTWRRHPDARWLLGPSSVAEYARLQYQLLRVAAGGVKPGGTLVYSVPTVPPAETSELIGTFLADQKAFRLDPFPNPLDGTMTDGTLRIWSHQADCDALYVARMVRSR